jgi:hypothetical protein
LYQPEFTNSIVSICEYCFGDTTIYPSIIKFQLKIDFG